MNELVWQFVSWVSSLVLGMSVVWKFVEKNGPKVRKALRIADETLDVVNAILDASSDKRITADELKVIVAQVEELREALQ
jgi:hypothetical protein